MYNVLEKLRICEALTPKELTIHDQGLVGVLKQLHDDLGIATARRDNNGGGEDHGCWSKLRKMWSNCFQ